MAKNSRKNVLPFVKRPSLNMPRSITVAEASRRLGVTRYRLERLIATDPTFPRPFSDGGAWPRVDLDALKAWASTDQSAASSA